MQVNEASPITPWGFGITLSKASSKASPVSSASKLPHGFNKPRGLFLVLSSLLRLRPAAARRSGSPNGRANKPLPKSPYRDGRTGVRAALLQSVHTWPAPMYFVVYGIGFGASRIQVAS